MNENTLHIYLSLQLRNLIDTLKLELPATHPAIRHLEEGLAFLQKGDVATPAPHVSENPFEEYENDDDFEDEDGIEDEPLIVPEGFADEDEYRQFMDEQGEEAHNGVSVAGVLPDGTRIGNFEESLARVGEIIAENEDEEPVEVDRIMTITYTRNSGEELTMEDVHTILAHPISGALDNLGTTQLVNIQEGDSINEQKASFAVLDDDETALKALALGALRYRGTVQIPGLGSVTAVGNVNFV